MESAKDNIRNKKTSDVKQLKQNAKKKNVKKYNQKKKSKYKSVSTKIISMNVLIVIIAMVSISIYVDYAVSKNLEKQATSKITALNESYMNNFNTLVNAYKSPLNRVGSEVEELVRTQKYDRKELYKYLEQTIITDDNISALTIMFEKDAYDGLDSEYQNTNYGTGESGKLSYYIFLDNGDVAFFNGIEDNEDEYNYDYYKIPMETGEMYVSEPYVFADSGKVGLTISKPIIVDGKPIGIVGSDIMVPDLAKAFENVTLYETGAIGIVLEDGTIVNGNHHEIPPSIIEDKEKIFPVDEDFKITTIKNESLNKPYEVIADKYKLNEDGGFYIVSTIPKEEITKDANMLLLILIIAFTVTSFVILALLYLVVERIMKPLRKLTESAKEVANGKLNIDISNVSNDEIGDLTLSLNDMANTITSLLIDVDEITKARFIGNKDFKMVSSNYQGEFANMADNINKLTTVYDDIIEEVLVYAESFANGDFAKEIKVMPGDYGVVTEKFLVLKEQLEHVEEEINNFIHAGVEGQLSYSVDTNSFSGGWADLLSQLNELFLSIATPIRQVSSFIENISSTGNYQLTMDSQFKGEFEVIRSSLNNMLSELFENIEEVSFVLNQLSNHRYNVTINREYIGDFSIIKRSVLDIIGQLNNVMYEISNSANVITSSAAASAETSVSLAEASTRQNHAISILLQDIEKVIGETNQNANSAKEANMFSTKTLENAKNGNIEMEQMLSTINEISLASTSIGNIISIIEDIAFQTNLLALNAAVEAARAGDHGKGFAVVADEVRSLAGRSQHAALETKELIEKSIAKVKEGTSKADSTSQALNAILMDISQVSDIIDRIANGSSQQAKHIFEFGTRVNDISDVANQNTSTSEESAAIAQEISAQSESLKNLVASFVF